MREAAMKWVLCTFVCLFSVPLSASVQIHISDPNTLEPLDISEVMVGSRVSFVVNADVNDFWSGGIFIEGQDRAIGQLQARKNNQDPNSRDWNGSHLQAAGPGAYVLRWRDSFIWGFDFYPDDFAENRKPGNWFVIDYVSLEEGVCNVDFYDHSYSFTAPDPNVSFIFLNTPTRDIHPDGYVNYADFALFSKYWLQENCSDPNNACYKADFSRNGSVGLEDVVMFADFWLYGNPDWNPSRHIRDTEPNIPDPNTSDPNELYDIIYAVVDVNSLPEITLQVGESVELYLVKSSTWEQTYMFNTEVIISDPNLGSIDNTSETAQILVVPRMSMFDDIAPGYTQPEGIEFYAIGLDSMLDGDMASFIYTANQPGDVTLDLVNYATPTELQSITIHQVQPIIKTLQQAYDESPELQQKVPEPEWDAFIESVKQSEEF